MSATTECDGSAGSRGTVFAALLTACAAAAIAGCGGRTTATHTRRRPRPPTSARTRPRRPPRRPARTRPRPRTAARPRRPRQPRTTATTAAKARTRTTATIGARARTAPSDHPRRPHPDLGPFAGYEWNVDVRSVHADWMVPHLRAACPPGRPRPWVGAEAPGTAGRAPFVQVGVHEGDTGRADVSPAGLLLRVLLDDETPLPAGAAVRGAAGGRVSATLRRTGRRWRIEIDDLTTGRSRTLSSAEGAGRAFNEAQVNQEDVTDSRTGQPYPYPACRRFGSRMSSVNRGVRAGERLDSSWLTEANGYLAPGPLRQGAFALAHVAMTAVAYRYLREIAAQDAATAGDLTALERWATGRPVGPGARRGPAARRHPAPDRVAPTCDALAAGCAAADCGVARGRAAARVPARGVRRRVRRRARSVGRARLFAGRGARPRRSGGARRPAAAERRGAALRVRAAACAALRVRAARRAQLSPRWSLGQRRLEL